jgi:hypothetical protein
MSEPVHESQLANLDGAPADKGFIEQAPTPIRGTDGLRETLKRLSESPSSALITLVDFGSVARDLSQDCDLSGAGDDVV